MDNLTNQNVDKSFVFTCYVLTGFDEFNAFVVEMTFRLAFFDENGSRKCFFAQRVSNVIIIILNYIIKCVSMF